MGNSSEQAPQRTPNVTSRIWLTFRAYLHVTGKAHYFSCSDRVNKANPLYSYLHQNKDLRINEYLHTLYGILTITKLTGSLMGVKDTHGIRNRRVPKLRIVLINNVQYKNDWFMVSVWLQSYLDIYWAWKTLASYEVQGIICVLV